METNGRNEDTTLKFSEIFFTQSAEFITIANV